MSDDNTISNDNNLQGSDWLETMAQRIVDGQLVPIISASVGDEPALGDYHALEAAYADHYRVPQSGLPEMSQFASIIDPRLKDLPAVKEGYLMFVKQRLLARVTGKVEDNVIKEADSQRLVTFSKFCDLLQYPRFEENSPLLILAKFDLPIFITTSYHCFLEAALRSLGKRPRTGFSRWNKRLEKLPAGIDQDYVPTSQEPLVYHVRGYDGTKDSLALTEDEHLRLLVTCSENKGRVKEDPVHMLVREALEVSSLILLGYNLRSWEFRSILWGLLLPRTDKTMHSVSIQIEAGALDQRYFDDYMKSPEIHLQAWWDTVEQCLENLRRAVEGPKTDG